MEGDAICRWSNAKQMLVELSSLSSIFNFDDIVHIWCAFFFLSLFFLILYLFNHYPAHIHACSSFSTSGFVCFCCLHNVKLEKFCRISEKVFVSLGDAARHWSKNGIERKILSLHWMKWFIAERSIQWKYAQFFIEVLSAMQKWKFFEFFPIKIHSWLSKLNLININKVNTAFERLFCCHSLINKNYAASITFIITPLMIRSKFLSVDQFSRI